MYMGWHEKARLSHKPAESGVASILRAPDAPRLWVRTKMHPKAETLADLGIVIAVDHLFRSTLPKLRYSRGDHAVRTAWLCEDLHCLLSSPQASVS